jgi:general secretion pathway protein I
LFRAAPSNHQRSSAGFTIIEALVALAVVASSLAAIGSVIATSVRGTRSIEQHVALVETARAIATGLPKRDELALGNFSGELAGHRWRVDVLPFAAGGVDAALSIPWVPQTVVITVRSPSGAVLQINTVRLHRRSNG